MKDGQSDRTWMGNIFMYVHSLYAYPISTSTVRRCCLFYLLLPLGFELMSTSSHLRLWPYLAPVRHHRHSTWRNYTAALVHHYHQPPRLVSHWALPLDEIHYSTLWDLICFCAYFLPHPGCTLWTSCFSSQLRHLWVQVLHPIQMRLIIPRAPPSKHI